MKVRYQLYGIAEFDDGRTERWLAIEHQMQKSCQLCPFCDTIVFEQNAERCPVCDKDMVHFKSSNQGEEGPIGKGYLDPRPQMPTQFTFVPTVAAFISQFGAV